MSERKDIRDGIISRLTGNTIAGTNVFNSRVYPIVTSEQPALNVYVVKEDMVFHTQRGFAATLIVAVDCSVQDNTTWQDTLDTLIDEVQTTLLTDSTFITLTGLLKDVGLNQMIYNGEGEAILGLATITFECEYVKDFEPTITDTLEGVDTKVDAIDPYDSNLATEGPDGTIEVEFNADPDQ